MNFFPKKVEPWRDWRVGREVIVLTVEGRRYGPRKIKRLTKTLVILENGVRFRRLDGTCVELTSFYIRCVEPSSPSPTPVGT